MSKSKYYYDKESLSYKKINTSKKDRCLSLLSFSLASFFFGTITLLIIINTPAINTPTELSQSRELKNYEIQIDSLFRLVSYIIFAYLISIQFSKKEFLKFVCF